MPLVYAFQEAVKQSGFAGEIAATIAEEGFGYLKAPIGRVGAPFTPVPMSCVLEDLCRVTHKEIVAEAEKIMAYCR